MTAPITAPSPAHTPTPWWIDAGRPFQIMAHHRGPTSTYCVASINEWADDRAADAAFIVRAVNAHDDLVKALDNLIGGFRGYLRARNLLKDVTAFPELKQADAALAKARGES